MTDSQIRRLLLGALAVVFLLVGIGGLVTGVSHASAVGNITGMALRVGVMLAVVWLAFGQLEQLLVRIPAWMFGILLLGSLIVVIWPKSIAFVVPALGLVLALQFVSRLLKK